jgi:hypothetical protein
VRGKFLHQVIGLVEDLPDELLDMTTLQAVEAAAAFAAHGDQTGGP